MPLPILTKSRSLALSVIFLFLSAQVTGKPKVLHGRALMTDLDADIDIQPGSPTQQFFTNATSPDDVDHNSGERQTICINEASGGSWCHENYKCCSRGNNKFYCCPNNRNCCPGENCCGSAGSCSTGNPCGNNSLCCPYADGYTCCKPNERCCGGRCCAQSR